MELLKKFEQITDVKDCFLLIEDAIKVQTANPVHCIVYLADIETGKLCDAKNDPLPSDGLCWKVYRSRETQPTKLLDQHDPIAEKVKQNCTFEPRYVYCQPVTDKDQVLSILVILTNAAQDISPSSLISITEKIVGCYRRLCKCHTRSLEQNSTSNQPNQLQTSLLKEAIIQLCGELYDQDAANLQIKVLKFLEEHTKAECAFLLLVVPETHELFCQVIRGKILNEEIRFPTKLELYVLTPIPQDVFLATMLSIVTSLLGLPGRMSGELLSGSAKTLAWLVECRHQVLGCSYLGHTSSFANALETKKPITLEDFPHDKRPGIEEFVGCKLQSLLCVPVSSRANEKLIALACVVNKKDKESFNNEDINVIKQCFQYTSTVLTSTLAFQNERKLKIQTQAMLQVARNLFTHLGELTLVYGKGLDNFPFIQSGLFEVNLFGPVSFERGHCRPYVPRRYGHSVNNSARLEGYKVIAEIEKQEKIANQLLGMEITQKNSPDKNVRHHQPIIKSPDKKRSKSVSPEKQYGHPYVKERRSLETDYMDFNPILESTRTNKPDIVLETEGANQDISVLERADGKDVVSFNLSVIDSEGREKILKTLEVDDDKESYYSDTGGLPPITPTYDRSVRQYFTPVEGFEETNDNVSFITARSPPQSLMYSADEYEDEIGAEEERSFHDSWQENELKLNTSCSDTVLMDGSPRNDTLKHSHFSDKEFQQPDARLSNSEPSLGNVNDSPVVQPDVTDSKPEYNETLSDDERPDIGHSDSMSSIEKICDHSIIQPEHTDSKPEFNYAFLRGSSADDIGSCHSADLQITDDQVVETYVSLSIIKDMTTSVLIIEDVDKHEKLTMSMNMLQTSASDVFSDMSLPQVSQKKVKFSPSAEFIRSISVPSTENIPFETNDLTKLLREIMQEARNLTQAERCSVFLIDQETDELVAKVFDGILANDNEVQNEIRMPITQGIAGHVATTGNLLNIKDAYAHPMFYRGIDDSTGFRTRNILCFPIKNETDNVLGVAQLCNKMNGPYFTTFDEDVASAFAVYCCISISHSLMYQKVIAAQYRNSLANELMVYHMKSLMYQKLQRSQHRNKLANELMIYHMQVAQDEVQELAQQDILPTAHWHPDFMKFIYPPREIPEDDTVLSCLTMFEDLGFISRWRIKRETLARFMLMVKRGYRNPPYHNWMHAFAVAHFCYLCIKNLRLTEYLEDIELFALFVSCLCHDIDHRGTNNSYQVASKSVLAALYSSEGAVLERHHFAQTMCIINTEGCNIFENLISKDYQHGLDLMRDIILATDLAHHLKILKNIEAMAKGTYEKSSLKHRKLLLCLIMTASDLSDQTKPWDSTKHIAALIYNEFFSQGDLEKSLGRTPQEMMDREKARIPDLQIGFLDHIALPVYRVLEEIFVEAHIPHKTVRDNHKHWMKICALIKLRRGGSCEQMSYDQILALEEEANDIPEDEIKSVHQNGH